MIILLPFPSLPKNTHSFFVFKIFHDFFYVVPSLLLSLFILAPPRPLSVSSLWKSHRSASPLNIHPPELPFYPPSAVLLVMFVLVSPAYFVFPFQRPSAPATQPK